MRIDSEQLKELLKAMHQGDVVDVAEDRASVFA